MLSLIVETKFELEFVPFFNIVSQHKEIMSQEKIFN